MTMDDYLKQPSSSPNDGESRTTLAFMFIFEAEGVTRPSVPRTLGSA